jgi:glutaminyl-tRNA synthetase
MADTPGAQSPKDFIRQIVAADVAAGRHGGRVVTRFPPEPNGYLHIGHAKSMCLNFGIALEHGGVCALRFDDTNPSREEHEFVEAIKADVRWMGFDWGDRLFHASDYFDQLYEHAEQLVRAGKAFVCSLTAEEIREHRGTLKTPGRDSPYRDRGVEENLDLLRRMRAGEFADGVHVLRARIDMASPNLNMRDPVIYRIMHHRHQMTGDAWCIYPMYDYAHSVSDSIEGVTHSLCTLEFEDHRPLYEWFLEQLDIFRSRQIEFSRLNLSHTVMSKRLLTTLVREGQVDGWDDPRMPTIQGLRRRGFTPAALRDFCARVGVTKKDNMIELELLETCLREGLDARAPRSMGVLRPLKVVIVDYPEGREETFDVPNHPRDPSMGTRPVPFGRTVWIERDDFMEEPPSKFFRLAPGREVRLRYAYLVTCVDVKHDPDTGEVIEVHCTHDGASRGGNAPDGRKVKGTIHWVSAAHAVRAEVRLYDRLFTVADPAAEAAGRDFHEFLNPAAKEVLADARIETALAAAPPETRVQLERLGYFCVDPDSSPARAVINRTVTLRDTWAKVRGGQGSRGAR